MIPFRVYDRDNKITWVVINYHPVGPIGSYLVAREDDSDKDGELTILSAEQVAQYRLVDFLDENE